MSAMRRAIHSLCLVLSGAGLALQAPALADSVPFWGASASVPIDRPFIQLKKVEFLWMGEAVSTGTACAFDGFVAALLALPMGGEDFDEIAARPVRHTPFCCRTPV